jgi:hypothetical protein
VQQRTQQQSQHIQQPQSFLVYLSRCSKSVYGATAGLANPFARNILVNTSQWSNAMSLNDSGRPIYNEVTANEQPGLVTPTSLRGRIAGLDLYVTANTAATTDTDDSIMIINPDAYTWYESPSISFALNQQRTDPLPWAFTHLVQWRQKLALAHSA